ncbi:MULTISPECIES: FtsX-like permease family protein [Streptomyces]|uniref:ABC transporter permease n=2 Tax=Streptomyces rimosus subsp. rimosus TaxID=132474 RepID=A0A8A1UXH7_STRR1|nr:MULTISPECIES: FtsX-like permease family protein [Streptomyces]MYT46253.1 ABC transporter permease [Streptomyces sp. SID5471]QST83234.1 ABC transporter permease [Streptomyces rimosus subsp. rimosus ATCC 10970]
MGEPGRHPVRRWCRDLAMGVRFAVGGGREGWIRTALTALGVGLGVAVLLVATAVPHAVTTAVARDNARSDRLIEDSRPGAHSLLVAETDTAYRQQPVRGRLVQPDGDRPALPPGVTRLPGPGEMVVSPALADLLASPDGALLRDRFQGARVVGRIGDEGLAGRGELAYYQGTDRLTGISAGVTRIHGFGRVLDPHASGEAAAEEPVLLLSVLVGCAALLTPVAVFIAVSVRFGGERRDRRLAALRLVGADRATTRRIAAGEALAGSLLGLLTGAVLFLAVRYPIARIRMLNLGVFPSDVVPDPWLTALVAVAVPVCSVGVALVTMRRVTVEPLGVTRSAPPVRRRLWWRLLLPAAGAALLWPKAAGDAAIVGTGAGVQVVVGTSLLLLGVAAVLPWLLDAVVARFGGGGVPSWQLAVRRLQLSTTAAARSVSGITVAVAGAVAVQLLLAGVQTTDPSLGYRMYRPSDANQVQVGSWSGHWAPSHAAAMFQRLRDTTGVRNSYGVLLDSAAPASPGKPPAPGRNSPPEYYGLAVGDCDALRRLARIDRCADGDVFLSRGSGIPDNPIDREVPRLPAPGARLAISPYSSSEAARNPTTWTLPHTARTVAPRASLFSLAPTKILATPGALDPALLRAPTAEAEVHLDPGRPDAVEYVRNAAARFDPLLHVSALGDGLREPGVYDIVGSALQAGAVGVLCIIGAGLLITVLEQLRERRRLLSALDAFGTPRRTLGRSVLWQTAVPVVLGLALAVGCGLGLGLLLLHLVSKPVLPDWSGIAALTGAAGAVILAVTALSLPLLWRLMRPDGLRTE